MPPKTLQDVVDAGFAPSVRWLATGIKQGRIPGRMIGRYWKNWRMTDEDFAEFLEGTKAPSSPRAPEPLSVAMKKYPLVAKSRYPFLAR